MMEAQSLGAPHMRKTPISRQKYTSRVMVGLTHDEHSVLVAAATKASLPLGTFVRLAVRRELKLK